MSEMVERVAKAIAEATYALYREPNLDAVEFRLRWETAARAAIEAMGCDAPGVASCFKRIAKNHLGTAFNESTGLAKLADGRCVVRVRFTQQGYRHLDEIGAMFPIMEAEMQKSGYPCEVSFVQGGWTSIRAILK